MGLYPVPGVDNLEDEWGLQLGVLNETCILLTPDESEIIEIHTGWPANLTYIYCNSTMNLGADYLAGCQSFIGDGSKLERAAFKVRPYNNPTDTIVAKLYAHSGVFGSSSLPTGEPLAVSNPLDAATDVDNYDGVLFTFPEPHYTLEDGVPYCLVIEYLNPTYPEHGPPYNYLRLWISTTSRLSGNAAAFSRTSQQWALYGGAGADFALLVNPEVPPLWPADVFTCLRRIDVATRSIVQERFYLNPDPNCASLSDGSNCFTCSPLYYYQACDLDENGDIYGPTCEGYGPLIKLRKSDFEIVVDGHYAQMHGRQTEKVRVSRNPAFPFVYSWWDAGFVDTCAVYLHHRDTLQNPFDQPTTESKFPEGWQAAGMSYDPFGFMWLGPEYFNDPKPYRQICMAGDIDNTDGGLWFIWQIDEVNGDSPDVKRLVMVKYMPDGSQLGPWDMSTELADLIAVNAGAAQYRLTFDEVSNQIILLTNSTGINCFWFIDPDTMTLTGRSPELPGDPWEGTASLQRGVVNGKIMAVCNDYTQDEWKLVLVDVNTRQIIDIADLEPYVTDLEYPDKDNDPRTNYLLDGLYIDSKKSVFVLLRQDGADMQEAVGFFS